MELFNSDTFTYIILPILIFLARICDVTLGTLRIILISKGLKHIAPFLGFFEVLIWVTVMGKLMQNLDNIYCYIAFAGGYSTGIFVGIKVEEKLALGIVVVRIITQKEADALFCALKEAKYGVTIVDAVGSQGPVNVIYSTIKRNDLKKIVEIIKQYNPNAFYTVEDIRYVNQGIFRNENRLKNMVMFSKSTKRK